jgi:hypothetical protein
LLVKQERDVELWQRHVRSLREFLALSSHREEAERLGIRARLAHAEVELERVSSEAYLSELEGTIGADPIHRVANQPRRGRQKPAVSADLH